MPNARAFVDYSDNPETARGALEDYAEWRDKGGYEPFLTISIGAGGARGVQHDMMGDAFATLLRLALPDNA